MTIGDEAWRRSWAAETRRIAVDFFGDDPKCSVCGESHEDALGSIADYALEFAKIGRKPLAICGICAFEIAQVFNFKHSGEALLPGVDGWPALAPREKSGRKKMSRARAMRIFERDGYACRSCGSQSKLEVDHVLALANGGSEDDDNLQTLCATCNRSKGAR